MILCDAIVNEIDNFFFLLWIFNNRVNIHILLCGYTWMKVDILVLHLILKKTVSTFIIEYDKPIIYNITILRFNPTYPFCCQFLILNRCWAIPKLSLYWYDHNFYVFFLDLHIFGHSCIYEINSTVHNILSNQFIVEFCSLLFWTSTVSLSNYLFLDTEIVSKFVLLWIVLLGT